MIASIIKRDGRVVCYDHNKIVEAIEKMWAATYRPTEDELENYRNFLRVMAELDWPVFFEYDPVFHENILQCVDSLDMERLLSNIYSRFDVLYLEGLERRLETSKVISLQRLPVLEQALLLYQRGYYYGTVSILVDQIAGIIKDIGSYVEKNRSGYSDKILALVSSRYRVSPKSEKGQLITALLEARETDHLLGEFDYMIGYFRMKFFKDALSPEELEENANRHSISHGNQCNYGTQEHALKLILCLDALEYTADILSNDELELDVG